MSSEGYTKAITAEGGDYVLFLLVQPDADLDGTFRAWDVEAEEFLNVNGWMFSITEGH